MNLKKAFLKFPIALLLLGLISNSCNQKYQNHCLNPSGFKIKRGVDLSHWLSQDYCWAPKYAYINESDIRFIDSIGYDHIRIPIEEKEMWDSTGNPIVEAFKSLTNCLEWCAKYNLRAIVDLHIIRAHHFNSVNDGATNTLWSDSSAQKNFLNLWVQLSDKLHSYPDSMVAYEILNEAVAPHHDDWNKLMNKAISVIRRLEPERVLIIGANIWQRACNLQYLKLPKGDRNIILSFHTYSPLALTHFKSNWTQLKNYKGSVHYPGQVVTNDDYNKYIDLTNINLLDQISDARDTFNTKRLVQIFKGGLEFAKLKNLQIYCGEFGCMQTVERKDRQTFYADMVSTLEENNIAWCNWEYKGDFGIYFFDTEKKLSHLPDFELIKILLKNSERIK